MRPARVLNSFISGFVTGYKSTAKHQIQRSLPTCVGCGRFKQRPFRFHSVNTIYTKVSTVEPCISIIKLAQQGRSRDALVVYFKMIEQEKKPSQEATYQLTKSLYKTNNLVGMHALHNTLVQLHGICPPSDRTRRSLTYFHTMFINLIARTTKDYDAIQKVCDMILFSNRKGNPVIYNTLIKFFLDKGDTDRAIKMYEELKRDGSPSIVTFNIWMKEADKKKDYKAMMSCLDEMKLYSISPDRRMVYKIVSILCRTSQFRTAKEFVEQLYLETRSLVPENVRDRLLLKIAGHRRKTNRQRKLYSVNKQSAVSL